MAFSAFTMHQCVLQCVQLLLVQLDAIGDFAQINNQFRFCVDEIIVVGVLFARKGFLQNAGDVIAPTIDVDFQSFRFFQLFQQTDSFPIQQFLCQKEETREIRIKKGEGMWYVYLFGGIGTGIQAIFGASQTTGQRQQQHRYVAHIIDVRTKFGGFAGSHFVRHDARDIGAEQIVGRTLIADWSSIVGQRHQLFGQTDHKLLLLFG